jgi:hypothetical protein
LGISLNEAHSKWIQQSVTPKGQDAVKWFEQYRENVNVKRSQTWSGAVGTFLSKFTPRPNECFKNAWELSQQIESALYVEGIIQAEICGLLQTTTHAWNIFEGQHIDITPVKNSGIVVRNEYIVIKKFSIDEILQLKKLNNAGCWIVSLEYYDKFINGDQSS